MTTPHADVSRHFPLSKSSEMNTYEDLSRRKSVASLFTTAKENKSKIEMEKNPLNIQFKSNCN